MSELDKTSRDYFDLLRQRSREEVARGEIESALATCQETIRWADTHGSADDKDLALCNRHAALVYQGRGQEVLTDLRKILMRSSDPTNRHLAAYNIAFIYSQAKDHAKSVFYAKVSVTHAEQSGSPSLLANSYNLQGNLLIDESHFVEANELYRQALEVLPADLQLDRSHILANMGYCQLTMERYGEGLRLLLESRRSFLHKRFRLPHTLCRLRLALSYGYIEIERYHRARLHGQAALRQAEIANDGELMKKALYMLGESEKLNGDTFAAYSCFSRLQTEFYPGNPVLPDLLMTTQTHKLINLWA